MTGSERKALTQPPGWWDAIEKHGIEERGFASLSEYVGCLCFEDLPASVASRLQCRPPAHRPKREQSEQG